MSQLGKVALIITFTVGPDQEAEGDRIFNSHADWMERTHPKAGELALLSYNLIKGKELSDQMDPNSAPTGNLVFIISEVYASEAGVANHWKLGQESWDDFGAMLEWAGKGKMVVLPASPIVHSLW